MGKSQMVLGGCNSHLHAQCLQLTGFLECSFPLQYLRIPITVSKLTKAECSSLVEKILAKVHIWATRHISFAWRAMLINNSACLEKKSGGLGLKDLVAWKKAIIAKLVWFIAKRKDLLWVKWVHGRYLKSKACWDYNPSPNYSWYWTKVCFTKECFKEGCSDIQQWTWQDNKKYTVSLAWIFAHHRLPTKVRLSKFLMQQDTIYNLCPCAVKDDNHLCFTCTYAQEIWHVLKSWWKFPENSADQNLMASLLAIKGSQAQTQITYALRSYSVFDLLALKPLDSSARLQHSN
ncbi:hypothetical protein Cgig2_013588 [Carnegiea gigantea]|uniref:Reverse transcriptase zinc-binding domain-containing protein n=1 Tax=Carnegiea gigantea TaxID=171969 RepID=A0A9Q1K9K8_9CARY|nr:hypothetical protein Cgig2_013588 [Carnegiea gigantea]